MNTLERPIFRRLEPDEIHALLARNDVGRIAYMRGTTIDVEPLHYVYADGWLYGRTSRGVKLDARSESWCPVAFEVDEIDGRYQWRSVVIRGGFYTLAPEPTGWERDAWLEAVRVLQLHTPEAFTPDDPTPHRDVVFRIAVQEVSGREALPPTAMRAGPAEG